LLDQAARYPFLEPLRPVIVKLSTLAGKDYTYLLNHLSEFQDDLLTVKDDLLSPIKAFMHGPQRTAYDEAIAFLREEEANFAELSASEVQPLRDLESSAHPYRGNNVPAAKAAVMKLRGILFELIKTERDQAIKTLNARHAKMEAIDDYAKLNASGKAQVMALTEEARKTIQSARFVTGIRDRLQRYTTQDYPSQLALAAQLAAQASQLTGKPGEKPPKAPDPVRYTPVANLRPECSLPYIASEADLDEWLNALREKALEEIGKGNRISL